MKKEKSPRKVKKKIVREEQTTTKTTGKDVRGLGCKEPKRILCMRPKKGKTEMRGWKEKGYGMYGRVVLQKGCRGRREKEGRRGWWEL